MVSPFNLIASPCHQIRDSSPLPVTANLVAFTITVPLPSSRMNEVSSDHSWHPSLRLHPTRYIRSPSPPLILTLSSDATPPMRLR